MLIFSKKFIKDQVDYNSKLFLERFAVRGIIVNNGKLLVVHSQLNGDFKLPGGGIKKGETELNALKREIVEECGIWIKDCDFKKVGQITEYKKPIEKDFDVFIMKSTYYFFDVTEYDFECVENQLDAYEEDLGFEAKWLDIDEVCCIQSQLLKEKDSTPTKWMKRELWVFELLKNQKNIFNLN